MSALAVEATASLIGVLELCFALAVGHMLCDFPLQGQFLATGKSPSHWRGTLTDGFGRRTWIWCLTAHSLIHGGAVWMVTGSSLLGLIEVVLHWLIDFAKAAGKFNFAVDQALHVVCKLLYLGLICGGVITVG